MMLNPSLPLARPIRVAAAAGIACLLAACAAKPATGPAPIAAAPFATDDQAIEMLRSGNASLDCGTDCAGSWSRARPELSRRLAAGDWRGLAALVLQTQYRQDLGYYYLGRAAEELGAGNAALRYYRTALSLTTGTAPEVRCATSKEGCDGASLPNDEVLHIQMAQGGLGRRPAVARAQPKPGSAPAGTATAPAADGWVDPPPANQ
ncbi:MAG TPA: hypothetical protein VM689_22215 [Aliidongia sp.]|nr:hypothetical protein [Aliidongia sp.]